MKPNSNNDSSKKKFSCWSCFGCLEMRADRVVFRPEIVPQNTWAICRKFDRGQFPHEMILPHVQEVSTAVWTWRSEGEQEEHICFVAPGPRSYSLRGQVRIFSFISDAGHFDLISVDFLHKNHYKPYYNFTDLKMYLVFRE